jgi:predicted acyl esterase
LPTSLNTTGWCSSAAEQDPGEGRATNPSIAGAGGRPENAGMVERRSWIPMEDGVRLAASLFLPEGAEAGRAAPVVLEALPYRKDDATASYRPEYERLCGEYGYAVARVDLRGTGSSEGVATDEYPASEQADLCQVIAWLAAQPWSTGSVGMYGTSYSGLRAVRWNHRKRARMCVPVSGAAGGRSAKSLSHPAGRIR